MKILVTGGAGFIASHIVDNLITLGHKVCIVDSMIHGREENVNKHAVIKKIDIRNNRLIDVFKEFKPEIVIHNAAQISVSSSIKNPLADASINILGSINVLESCRKVCVRKIIYPASAAIFGPPLYLPIDENHPLNMISGYGVTKHTVEHYLQYYKSLYNIDYVILRYSNVYGPRQDSTGEGGVISIFCDNILKNISPYIYGDGEQLRDFIYVKDIVSANIMAIEYLNNGIYNVCSSNKISVNELLVIINEVSNKNIKPIYTSERIGDIRDSYMTYGKMKDEIGWEPKYDLYSGIKETIEYLK